MLLSARPKHQTHKKSSETKKKMKIMFVYVRKLISFYIFLSDLPWLRHTTIVLFFIVLSVPSPILRFYCMQETSEFIFRDTLLLVFPPFCGCFLYTWRNLLKPFSKQISTGKKGRKKSVCSFPLLLSQSDVIEKKCIT